MFLFDDQHFHYNMYLGMSYIAPIVLLCLCGVGLIAAIYCFLFLLVQKYCHCPIQVTEKFSCCTSLTETNLPGRTLILGVLRLIYGHEIKECEKPNKTYIYTISDRCVHPVILVILFFVAVFIHCCTAVPLWCEFFIEESNHCDEHMDCFALNGTNTLEIEEGPQPLQNCSSYELQNYTIHCFRFSFDYASAIGEAGGVLVMWRLVMSIQAVLWIGALSQKARCYVVAVVAVVVLNVFVVVSFIVILILAIKLPALKSLTATNRRIVKFFAYWFTFLITFITSGPIFVMSSEVSSDEILSDQTEVPGGGQKITLISSKQNKYASTELDNAGGKDLKHEQII